MTMLVVDYASLSIARLLVISDEVKDDSIAKRKRRVMKTRKMVSTIDW